MKKIISVIFGALSIGMLSAQTNTGNVIITEIMYDTPENENTQNGQPYSNGEYIEIFNLSDKDVSLAGWSLHAADRSYTFPQSATIEPHKFKVIAFYHPATPEFVFNEIYQDIQDERIYTDVFYQNSLLLDNAGASVCLKDVRGTLRDSLYYEGEYVTESSYPLRARNLDGTPGMKCISLQRISARLHSDGSAIYDRTEWTTATVTPFAENPLWGQADIIGANYIKIRTYTADHGKLYHDRTQFYDGLGYLEQEVAYRCTPTLKNQIELYEYDAADRQIRKWLPISTDKTDYIKPYQIKEIGRSSANYNDQSPFLETVYEAGSIDRVIAKYKAGHIFHQKDKKQATEYNVNEEGDTVIFYEMDKCDTALCRSGYHPAGTLIKECVKDEDGRTRIEYFDQRGRKVLTRTLPLQTSTYYVYDGLDRLRMVIPDTASKRLNLQVINASNRIVKHFCYYYRYDENGNILEKQTPGREREYFIHNVCNNNLVLWQDGNLRKKNQWIYTVYDNLNRVFEKRLVSSNKTMQDIHAGASSSPFIIKLNSTPLHDNHYVEQNMTFIKTLYQARYDGSTYKAPLEKLSFRSIDNMIALDDIKAWKGKKVYEKCLVLDAAVASQYVERAFYYDKLGRLAQTVEKNHLGGISRTTQCYDFLGNTIIKCEDIQPGPYSLVYSKKIFYTYDSNQRLIEEQTVLNNGTSALMRYQYDEQSRIIKKIYGQGDRQIVETYSYNVPGWETSRKSTLLDLELRYYDPQYTLQPSYTGNISEWQWQHKDTDGSKQQHVYAFAYDGLSRLKDTEHYVDGVRSRKSVEGSIRYDNGGNILNFRRYDASGTPMSVSYRYDGNQLQSVSNSANYAYDANGNMIHDGNRNLDVTYNYMNLIQCITQNFVTKAKYRYLCDGTKLSVNNPANQGYEYLGSMVFCRSNSGLTLESVSFSEGRFVQPLGADMQPYFYLTDHLGSTRVVVDAAGNVRERNDYYAFGKRWEDPEQPISDNRYLYNGKEKQVTGNIGYSDYGARMNDDLIGRWFIPDPLAEDYFETSPYVFCANNPIRYIDKVGTKIVDVSGNILYQDGKWTKYADGTDAMLIGSTMLQTPTGTDIWERMAESSTRILFEIKSELSYGKKGGLALGVATHKSFSNYVKITLFEGSINEYIRLDKIFNDSEKQELMRNSTRQERLTGVAVHEGTHALDRIFDDKRELRANQNEIKYLKEVEKNRPIIEDEDLNRTINKFLRTN